MKIKIKKKQNPSVSLTYETALYNKVKISKTFRIFKLCGI